MLDARAWARLTDLFHQATTLPPEQRIDFACTQAADDPALREELLAMLAADATPTVGLHQPLQRAAEAMLRAAVPDLAVGTRFGPWAVRHKLAAGGMGSVYLADRADGAYERQVALKLVALPAAGSVQRGYFEHECRLLAKMQHPSIAQIHDAGVDAQGYGYLVMEYIQGQAITAWCDAHRATLRQRVQLLVEVAEGVQHAHQKGVIHRDLKPGNVLVETVDGRPLPRIIDFGIASGEEDPAQQRAAGTPGYMCPEQARGEEDIDARADIYSLGALLHALVLGLDPGAAADPLPQWDALAPARRDELAALRATTARGMRRDLDDGLAAVITRAMAAQRDQRYPATDALVSDLRLWLAGQVPRARGQSRALQVRKFIARHRLAVSAAAVTTLAVLGGFAATAWSLQQAREQASRARLSADFLASILNGVDPSVAQDLDKTLMLRVLDEASARAATELAAYPDTLADIELVIAINYNDLEFFDRAADHLQAVLALSERHPKLLRLQRLRALQVLGPVEHSRERIEQGIAVLRQGIAEAREAGGEYLWMAWDMQSRLSWSLLTQGQGEQALALGREALAGLEALRGPEDQQRLDAARRLASVLAHAGEYAQALALLDEVIARRTQSNGAEHMLTLSAREERAVALLQSRQFAAAEPELRAILQIYRGRYGQDSGHVATLSAYLGSSLREQGKVAEAGPYYRLAMDWNQRRYGPESFSSVITRHNHANWLLADGQAAASSREQQALLEIARSRFGEQNLVTGEILRNLAQAQSALGQHAEARANAQTALEVMRAVYGDDAPNALRDARQTLTLVEQAASGGVVQGASP